MRMTSARFSQLAVGLTGGLSDKRRLIWSWQVMKIGKGRGEARLCRGHADDRDKQLESTISTQ
jgi:hypothetical protein